MKPNLLAPAAVALTLAGCAENRTSIAITGRAAPSNATSCEFAAGGRNVMSPGKLDVSFADHLTYSTVVYVKNNLVDPTTLVPEAVPDAKAWRATAARVRVNPQEYADRFGASPALLSFTGENTTPLDGQTTRPGGESVQFVDVVSRSLGTQIAAAALASGTTQMIILGITLEGMTLDGARVDSGEWFFPVEVCNGCLQPVSVTCTGPFRPGNCFGFGQDTEPVCSTSTTP